MGEKGNVVEDLGVAAAAGTATAAVADPSVIERVTTTTRESVVGVSQDLLDKIKDKGIESTADGVIGEGRDRLKNLGGKGATPDSPPADGAPPEA